mmetsp:Transcript_9911/g.30500  ORF Transcript_9911/g.30500 Transcript_9911/m.30500 type:complete len:338 (-) Transcript_9911:182-1195(-)
MDLPTLSSLTLAQRGALAEALHTSWPALADHFEIAQHLVATNAVGGTGNSELARSVVDLLYKRAVSLNAIAISLRDIGRADLVPSLSPSAGDSSQAPYHSTTMTMDSMVDVYAQTSVGVPPSALLVDEIYRRFQTTKVTQTYSYSATPNQQDSFVRPEIDVEKGIYKYDASAFVWTLLRSCALDAASSFASERGISERSYPSARAFFRHFSQLKADDRHWQRVCSPGKMAPGVILAWEYPKDSLATGHIVVVLEASPLLEDGWMHLLVADSTGDPHSDDCWCGQSGLPRSRKDQRTGHGCGMLKVKSNGENGFVIRWSLVPWSTEYKGGVAVLVKSE